MVEILTPEKKAEYEKIFHEFDKNKDGKISPKELTNCNKITGKNLTSFEAFIFLLVSDENKDGFLDLNEFLFLMAMGHATPEEQNRLAFRFFDKDNDGFIDAKEFIIVMKGLFGVTFTEKDARDAIQTVVNPKAPGKISFEEFVKLIAK